MVCGVNCEADWKRFGGSWCEVSRGGAIGGGFGGVGLVVVCGSGRCGMVVN